MLYWKMKRSPISIRERANCAISIQLNRRFLSYSWKFYLREIILIFKYKRCGLNFDEFSAVVHWRRIKKLFFHFLEVSLRVQCSSNVNAIR